MIKIFTNFYVIIVIGKMIKFITFHNLNDLKKSINDEFIQYVVCKTRISSILLKSVFDTLSHFNRKNHHKHLR